MTFENQWFLLKAIFKVFLPLLIAARDKAEKKKKMGGEGSTFQVTSSIFKNIKPKKTNKKIKYLEEN